MNTPPPNILLEHNETKQKIHAITDMAYQSDLVNSYNNAYGECTKNIDQLKGGLSSDQLLGQMILPDEHMSNNPKLYVSKVMKIDSNTGNIYETRFGIECTITNKRMIITDVDVDNTPVLEKSMPTTSSRMIVDQNRVGHQIRESIFFQPIQLGCINSIVVDIHNSTEASQLVSRERDWRLPAGIFVLSIIAAVFAGYLAIVLGGFIAVVVYINQKKTDFKPPWINVNYYRAIRIGLEDPESRKNSIWIMVADNNYPPKNLLSWASELQANAKKLVSTE